jgi:hypothetical protein
MGPPIPRDEVLDMLRLFKVLSRGNTMPLMERYQKIAEVTGYELKAVAALIKRHQPSIDHAKMILHAGTAKMAQRLVNRANTSEIIDIFSRPNIGILAPKASSEGGGGGFFLSVQTDSLGGVKVGVAGGQRRELPAASEAEEEEAEADASQSALNVRGEYLKLRRERLGVVPQLAEPEPEPPPLPAPIKTQGWVEPDEPTPTADLTAATTVIRSKHSRDALEAAKERLATPPKRGRRNNYHRPRHPKRRKPPSEP